MQQQTQEDLKRLAMIPKVFWVAFLVSQITIPALLWHAGQTLAPALDQTITQVLLGIGCLMPFVGGKVYGIMAAAAVKSLREDDRAFKDEHLFAAVLPAFIIGLAMRESGAIFAGVVLFLGMEPVPGVIPAVLAFVFTFYAYPGASWFQDLRARATGAGRM